MRTYSLILLSFLLCLAGCLTSESERVQPKDTEDSSSALPQNDTLYAKPKCRRHFYRQDIGIDVVVTRVYPSLGPVHNYMGDGFSQPCYFGDEIRFLHKGVFFGWGGFAISLDDLDPDVSFIQEYFMKESTREGSRETYTAMFGDETHIYSSQEFCAVYRYGDFENAGSAVFVVFKNVSGVSDRVEFHDCDKIAISAFVLGHYDEAFTQKLFRQWEPPSRVRLNDLDVTKWRQNSNE